MEQPQSNAHSYRVILHGTPSRDGVPSAGAVEVARHEIALRSDQYKAIFNRLHGTGDKKAPWLKGVVRVCVPGARPMYLRYRGTSKLKDGQAALNAWMADRLQLLAGSECNDESLTIQCTDGGRWIGPFWHYWQHLEDAARVSFQLGMIGLVLAVVALILDRLGW